VFALRLLYLPSIAIAILVTSAVARGGALWQRSIASALVLISIVGALATSSANLGWADDEKVYGRIIYFAPSDLGAHKSLAHYYRDRGVTDKTVITFLEVARLSEGKERAKAYAEIGAAYGKAGNLVASRHAYLTATEIDDELSNAWLGLGNLAFLESRFSEAISYYFSALEWDPENYEACVNLGLVYRKTGDVQRALAFERKAKSINRE
jgi:tetratricopeptide (TPR) repeat protein